MGGLFEPVRLRMHGAFMDGGYLAVAMRLAAPGEYGLVVRRERPRAWNGVGGGDEAKQG